MSIKTNEFQKATGLSGADEFLMNVSGGTARVPAEDAAEYFGDEHFDRALWLYDGVDLTVKFADEIAAVGGDPWAWIKSRLTAHNVKGLHPKDYIMYQTTDGKTIKSQIAGINQYLHFNDAEITGWHIDWISRDLWPELHVWNKANYNNGISTEKHPYMCSDLRAWLNSLKTTVPNGTTVNPDTVEVDYSTTGVYDKLPDTLKAVIVNKRALMSTRYSADGLLTDDNGWDWCDLGNLWVPSEMEVYGCCAWGTKGFSQAQFTQYPIFRDSKMRIKGLGNGGSRYNWWLLTPYSGDTVGAASVYLGGESYLYATPSSWVGAPVCFRIAE